MRSVAIVAGETRVRLGDVGGKARALRRRPPILLWHRQDLERGLRPPAAAHVQLEDLGLAAGGGELQIALGAVDLPEQVRPARTPTAVMDRERGPALEQSADAHLIIHRHGLAFARLRDREGLSAHGHGGRELSDLAEAVTQRVRRVAERDREHRRAVLLVVEIRARRLHRRPPARPPAHSRTDQRGGEHLTDVALLDQVTHVRHRRREAGLQAHHGEDALLLRQRGQGLRLVQAVPERPFAVHSLARAERRGRQFQVIRHLHGDGDHVHSRAVHEVLVIVEGGRHTKVPAGGVGRFASRGGQRRDLEVIRERRQGRNVRLRRPSAIRIGADDADPNSLGSGHANRLVSVILTQRFRLTEAAAAGSAPRRRSAPRTSPRTAGARPPRRACGPRSRTCPAIRTAPPNARRVAPRGARRPLRAWRRLRSSASSQKRVQNRSSIAATATLRPSAA